MRRAQLFGCVLAAMTLLAACGSHPVPRALRKAGSPASRSMTSTGRAGSVGAPPTSTTSAPEPAGAPCVASSTGVPASVTAPGIAAVQFVDAQQGFAAGAGRLLATSNGGASWRIELSGSFLFGEVDFVSATHGWAVAGDSLLGTADGGSCWVLLGEPAVGHLRSVHFGSTSMGWGVAGGTAYAQGPVNAPYEGRGSPTIPVTPLRGGVLVATTDGGRSWHAAAGAPANAESACFVNARDGWLGAGGAVYRSVDGGASWGQVANPTAAGGGTGSVAPWDRETLGCGAPSSVWVVSATGGVAAGTSPWAVFSSTDGAAFSMVAQDEYAPLAVSGRSTPGTYPGIVSVIGPSEAAVAGFTPALAPQRPPAELEVFSASGAALGSVEGVPGMAAPAGLAFLSAADGWVAGNVMTATGAEGTASVIDHTTDGGRSWTVQYQTAQ
ncbi:MAG: WD40/YVTN/BNR-like repeat-containing protein [Acidimicrobiales bacterium]